MKIFFQIILDEVPKTCNKIISADVKPDVKQQEIKELVVVFSNFLYVPSKLEIQCKTWMYFSFNFTWYSIQFYIGLFKKKKQRGWRIYFLNNPLEFLDLSL